MPLSTDPSLVKKALALSGTLGVWNWRHIGFMCIMTQNGRLTSTGHEIVGGTIS